MKDSICRPEIMPEIWQHMIYSVTQVLTNLPLAKEFFDIAKKDMDQWLKLLEQILKCKIEITQSLQY
jgi:hypothetical protein